jgi:hypothetical protein
MALRSLRTSCGVTTGAMARRNDILGNHMGNLHVRVIRGVVYWRTTRKPDVEGCRDIDDDLGQVTDPARIRSVEQRGAVGCRWSI